MTKTEKLIAAFASMVKAGGGIHTMPELAFMLGEAPGAAFTKFLTDCIKKGVIRRVARGVFESTVTPANPATAVFKTAMKLRDGVLNYISLESQLSHTGDISQLPLGRLTVMTKGRSGIFTTPYGVIEFTHTKQPIHHIMLGLYFDDSIGMYRANASQAKADLTSCHRNLHMLES